jgi:hypothetical protein
MIRNGITPAPDRGRRTPWTTFLKADARSIFAAPRGVRCEGKPSSIPPLRRAPSADHAKSCSDPGGI